MSFTPEFGGLHRFVAAAALIALAGPALGATPETGDSLELILEARRGDERTRADVVGELVALGNVAIPGLYAMYAGFEQSAEQDPSVQKRWWCAPDELGALALEALRGLPPEAVIDHLGSRGQAEGEDASEVALACAAVLAELRDARGLELLMQRVADVPAPVLRSRLVRSTLESAIASIVRSDSTAVRTLMKLAPELESHVIEVVVGGVRAADDPNTFAFLTSLFGRTDELDVVVIEGVSHLQDRFAWRTALDIRAMVRARLGASSHAVRRAAAIACGRMRDAEAFEELIEVLHDDNPGVRNAALGSLRRISGRRSLKHPEDWLRWHHAEVRWQSDQGDDLLNELGGDQPDRIVNAVRALSRHPIARVELAEQLARSLAEVDGAIVPSLCEALVGLDERAAVPGLIDALELADAPSARHAAWIALSTLTGEDFPADAAAWSAFAFD